MKNKQYKMQKGQKHAGRPRCRFIFTAFLKACFVFGVLLEFFIAGSASAQVPSGYSLLWGRNGSRWAPQSRLPDFSFAGYACGERSIPEYPVTANVKDFGARGDGVTDDTAAFRTALARTQAGAILVPAGRYRITDEVYMNKSGVVFRGEGKGKTILVFPKSMTDLHGPANDNGQSYWSYTGAFFGIVGQQSGSKLLTVVAPALRGAKELKVSPLELQALNLAPGMWLRLSMNNDPALGRLLHSGRMFAGEWTKVENPNFCNLVFRVASVGADTIVMDRPLRMDVRPEWKAEIHSWNATVENSGLESLTFEFPGTPKNPHLQDLGYNAMVLDGVANCWIRNVEVVDADNGIFLHGASRFCTIEGFTARVQKRSTELTGHHAVWLKGAQDCLVTGFDIPTQYEHDLSVEGFANGNVFSNGYAKAPSFDQHASVPFENLYTNIRADSPTAFWNSSGAWQRGPSSGSRTTFWNIHYPLNVYGLRPIPNWPEINVIGVREAKSVQLWSVDAWIEAQTVLPLNLHQAQLQRRLNPLSNQRYAVINAKAQGSGTISPAGVEKVPFGTSKTYEIIPTRGYKIKDVLVDGVSVGPLPSYAFYSYAFNTIVKNHTITAVFEPIILTISLNVSEGGVVRSVEPYELPRGPGSYQIKCAYGSSRSFAFIPYPGYRVAGVWFDARFRGPLTTFTANDIRFNYSLNVSFERVP